MQRTGALRLGTLPTAGSAARSGLQQGDLLPSIGGANVSRANWQEALERYKPGDRVKVQAERYGRTVDVELEIGEPDSFSYRLEDLPDVSAEARRMRSAWLTGK